MRGISRMAKILAELLHTSSLGSAVVFMDMTWKCRIVRAWGNIRGDYGKALFGMAFRGLEASDKEEGEHYDVEVPKGRPPGLAN